jgi:septal ring factor EnvC (AmiA/AmiB activator)
MRAERNPGIQSALPCSSIPAVAKAVRQASLEELAPAQRRIAALERKIGHQQSRARFFSASLASQGTTPAERRAWQDSVYEVIQAMTASRSQGEIGIERMCQLAAISGSSYYRHWQRWVRAARNRPD